MWLVGAAVVGENQVQAGACVVPIMEGAGWGEGGRGKDR